MGRKLYVGNLPFSATQEALGEKPAELGKLESVKVVTEKVDEAKPQAKNSGGGRAGFDGGGRW